MTSSRRVTLTRNERAQLIAEPYGPTRENPPHLGDLRAFVALCEGMPDGAQVTITPGTLNEAGRRTTTFLAVYTRTEPEES